jgi:hypothetical protein
MRFAGIVILALGPPHIWSTRLISAASTSNLLKGA